MNEKDFLDFNGVDFEDDNLEEAPEEEIIYDWDSEVVYE